MYSMNAYKVIMSMMEEEVLSEYNLIAGFKKCYSNSNLHYYT